MQVGDLVRAKYDIERDIWCVGVVTDIDNSLPKNFNIKVQWNGDQISANGHYGWHQEEKLEKFE